MEILRAWRIYVMISALVLVFAWVVAESQPFQSCVNTEYSANSANAAQKPPKEITPTFEIYGGCAGGFLQTTEGEGLITAFATLLIAFFTGILYAATKEQGRLTQLTADIAKDSLLVGHAAFIHVDRFWFNFFWDENDRTKIIAYAFHPIWQNGGGTQTRDMRTHVDFELLDRPIRHNFPFTDNTAFTFPALIGPKSSIRGGSAGQISTTDLKAVKAGTKFLYLWGWARYRDIFPDTPPHLTRYCYQVVVGGDVDNPGADGSGAIISYLFHLEGNCADGECIARGLG